MSFSNSTSYINKKPEKLKRLTVPKEI